ncbi:MAG: PVC-type heme-binding CxxCH protein [Roseimicrobium sp.]
MPRLRFLLLLCASLLPFSPSSAEDANRLIRSTEALPAVEELTKLHVPEGFSVQFFADETLLGGKPINMAFDARGRLWVSSTREYPFAVKKDRWSADTTRAKDSQDTIRILEDTDGDGRADKVTVFADELNIPTGVLPYKNGCIAWSIPNLLYLEDTDGDGQCDQRRILFGPLGYEKDTHGMISSLRLGLDGWVYATHGFSNTSHFEVRPENLKSQIPDLKSQTLDLTSGSVFRFRPDGSRVELWTSGQVNPFGLCWDSWGNLYSADCHSNPITQLIRGAEYPQFGKPTGPLGYGPVMCQHAHGSTGLCGIIYIDGGVWGPEWDDHMFVGNCVTSRVNHDHITFTGTTPKANEAPDFLTSDDPWFRPVDLQLGPDSALYVADFYNRIIGHYEVPLDHVGRDRERGRIWRVVREGFTGKLTECDLSKRDAPGLVAELKSPNLTRRYQATEQLVSRVGRPALRLTREKLSGKPEPADAPLISDYDDLIRCEDEAIHAVHSLWVASRLGDEAIAFRVGRALITGGPVLSGDPERLCVTAINIIAEKPKFGHEEEEDVCDAEFDGRGVFSMRAAGLAMVQHAAEIATPGCLFRADLFNPADGTETPIYDSGDAALIHVWKMAVRAELSHPGRFEFLDRAESPGRRLDEIAHIAATVPTAEAASWLLGYVQRPGAAVKDLPAKLTHIARYLPADRDGELVTLAQKHFGDDLDTQLALLAAIREGRSGAPTFQAAGERPAPTPGRRTTPNAAGTDGAPRPGAPLTTWATSLGQRLLDTLSSEPAPDWQPLTAPSPVNPSPWFRAKRKCADGQERDFLDSHPPGGEKLTGTLRSKGFPLPEKLSFWLAGHRGFPTAAAHEKNFVRLVDATTGAELARAYPPRHDTARQVVWDIRRSPSTSTPSPSARSGPAKAGTSVPRSEASVPRSEASVPRSEASVPRSEASVPRSEASVPRSEASVPRSEASVPRSEASVPRYGTPEAFLELVDGDSGTAYAWLAVGGFSPEVVTIPDLKGQSRAPRLRALAQLCRAGLAPAGAGDFLRALPGKHTFDPDTREALAQVASMPSSDLSMAALIQLVRDNELAETVMGIVSSAPSAATDQLAAAFKTLPFRNQAKLAVALAGTRGGTEHLLALAPPRVLADPLVSTKIKALGDAALTEKLTALTASLPPENEAARQLIAQRLKSFDAAKADTARGEQVFTAVCSVCHRIGVRGNLVGPQLDGIGVRGAERLLEDILDPNRAVDPAFRLHLVKRRDGTLHTGLLRREDGDAFVYADATAQETRVAKADIAQDEVSAFSLMPPGLGEALTEEQLHDLLAYLLARK